MPISNIPINRTSPLGPNLASAVQQLLSAKNAFTQILLQMQDQTDFTTYTAIETAFGLPSGQGSNVYGLVFAVANPTSTNTGVLYGASVNNVLGQLN